jgi:hypothetical protein
MNHESQSKHESPKVGVGSKPTNVTCEQGVVTPCYIIYYHINQ